MNYVWYHFHTDLSNCVTNVDSITKYKQYVELAKQLNMKAMAFSEHGSCMEWYHKKQAIENAGMLYIHGEEFYVTETLDEKVRDNYHLVMLARNYDGFHEINRLVSKSFDRSNNSFYYVPRISIDDVLSTSDNVIITSACLGGPIAKGNEEVQKKFIDFFTKNKDRCFFEIQHHNVQAQKDYNRRLVQLSKETGVRLIAGTDTHALNAEHLAGRKKLQEAKDVHFADEDEWDLTAKSYEELCEAYEKQNAIPSSVWHEAIENTNLLPELVEPFKISTEYKYPKLYENGEKVLKEKINQGFVERGINKKENKKEYIDRIRHEMEAIEHNGASDFFLLEEDYKRAMREKGINCGPSRGSVSGSEICYLLHITDVDSIKYNLNFDRFMNVERVSLADVDSDWSPDERDQVIKYLYTKEGLYCADIVTFNTIKLKGAFTDIARAYGLDLREVRDVTHDLEGNEEKYRKKYPEIFKYVDLVNGVIVSMGNHPSACIVSPFPLEEEVGLVSTSTDEYRISQLNMKEIDSLNYVKLDVLRLENVGIINKTCDMAGIPRLTPDNMDFDDEEVWKSIREDTVGVFQWESNSSTQYLKKLFSDETIRKIRKVNPNFSYLNLLSVGNGAIRPAGESYRDRLAVGEFNDNGHPALNELLKNTNGFLVYQEQIIAFLHQFCGYSMGQADIVRRHFSKKTGTEEDIPKIKEGFIKTMGEKCGVSKEEAEQIVEKFLRVIEDASDYLFSENHALPYSMIGYACAWLRYHYPLEFCTAYMNTYFDDEEKLNKIIAYMEKHGIKLEPPKFRHSIENYICSKENNTIYKGLKSIKFISVDCAKQLYDIRMMDFPTFTDLLVYISENTTINIRQVRVLTTINFFFEFGKNKKLLSVLELFGNRYSKQHTDKTKVKRVAEIKKFEADAEDVALPLNEQIELEQEYVGYITVRIEDIPKRYVYVKDIDTKYTPRATLYCLNTGKTLEMKIDKRTFAKKKIKKGDVIYCKKFMKRENWSKTDDGFVRNGTFSDYLLDWKEGNI